MAEHVVKAPMRGRVFRVHVETGSQVKERDRMCDIEALKMEMPIMAPVSGTIKEVCISVGQQIGGGDTLFVIES
jgi:biotin carboxyl carrier protein